jgi:hypothetical protein
LPCLSWMSCPRYPLSAALVVASGCPVHSVIIWPFCFCFLSWLHYPICLSDFPVPVLLSPAFLSWLSCSSCLVPAVLFQLPCPGCPVQAVLYQLIPGCPVLAIPSRLSCPCCPVLAAQPRHPYPQLS